MRHLVLICALIIATLPSFAQTSDFARLLQGKTHPSSLTLKELNSEWRRFTLEGTGGSQGMGGYLQMIYSMMGLGGSAGGSECYTKGDTVEIAGQVFLVAYKLPTKPVDLTLFSNPEAMKNAGKTEALTPESKLLLSLINFKSASGFFNIRAFDLQQELKESKERSKATTISSRLSNITGGGKFSQ